jgi:hypothetical protein
VAKGPLQITNAQAQADQLNGAKHAETDVEAESVYATAGMAKDGIVKRIQEQMAVKFPQVPCPELSVPAKGAVAYAYLGISAKFDTPFFENDEPLVFKDASGKQFPANSFGIRKKDDYAYYRLRKQVRILYRSDDGEGRGSPVFIVDPCKTSQPYQIVLARLNRERSLAETLAAVERKIGTQPVEDTYESALNPVDTLLVPNMAWRITHHFKELEGNDKLFTNPTLRGLYLDTALQTIQFRLDRFGAELASESKQLLKPTATDFHFNRPFFLYMKKRGAARPFFVMWVDNSELLEKR